MTADSAQRDTCTFSELAPLFQELFDPEPARLTALIGRMKNVLRIGGLPDRQVRKGQTEHFTMSDVRRFMVIMDLCDIGVAPAKAILLYERNKEEIERPVLTVAIQFTGQKYLQVDKGHLYDTARKHLPWFFYAVPERGPRTRHLAN